LKKLRKKEWKRFSFLENEVIFQLEFNFFASIIIYLSSIPFAKKKKPLKDNLNNSFLQKPSVVIYIYPL